MMRKMRDILFYVIAAFYAFMLADLFFRFSYIFDPDRVITRSYNLIPFRTIWEYLSGNAQVSAGFVWNNTLGNMIVFLPFGLYLQVLQKNKAFMRSLIGLILISAGIEITQFIFGLGACDIDDIILNTCGGALGILLYGLLRRVCKEEGRTKTVVTILSLVVGLPVIYLFFTTVFNHLRL